MEAPCSNRLSGTLKLSVNPYANIQLLFNIIDDKLNKMLML